MDWSSDIDSGLRKNAFQTIDLAGLNASSELLDRQERKYVARRSQIPAILKTLAKHFFVLEHVGKRVFRYDSVYFDDDYVTYQQHHQGKRRRFKVRSRLYADSGVCVFEMKVKRYRGCTDKRRISYDPDKRFDVNTKAQSFLRKFYLEAYGEEFLWELAPVLSVINDRVTFVAKEGGERLTMDFNTTFENSDGKFVVPRESVIIETKTGTGFGLCDRLLRKHHLRPQRWCSKYCLGVAELGLVPKKNTFLPVLKLLRKHGEPEIMVKH